MRERETASAIEKLGGRVQFAYKGNEFFNYVRFVDLSRTKITDAELQPLLAGLSQLDGFELCIDGTEITDAVVKNLQELPNCKLYHRSPPTDFELRQSHGQR